MYIKVINYIGIVTTNIIFNNIVCCMKNLIVFMDIFGKIIESETDYND